MDLKRYEEEVSKKFGMQMSFGTGVCIIENINTSGSIKIGINLAWLAHVRYLSTSYVIAHMKSDIISQAIVFPTKLDEGKRATILPIVYDSETLESALNNFSLVHEDRMVVMGKGSVDLDINIYTPRMSSSIRYMSASPKHNHTSHNNLWQSLLIMSQNVIHLSNNEHLNAFAKDKRWLAKKRNS